MDAMKGKVAVVTGGGSGIGRASSIEFAREGARVAIADLAIEEGEKTVAMIKDMGGEAFFSNTDVSLGLEVEKFIGNVYDTYGSLEFAHNNVGTTGERASTVDCTEENWEYVINTSLKSVWLCMKHEIPLMIKGNGGAIVNTSSTAGLLGFRKGGAYAASKHGVIGLTRTAALEYAKDGIRVNAVCPGLIDTPAIQQAIGGDPETEVRFASMSPAGRMGTPEEVAKAVAWLCSEGASYINGQAIAIDGGFIIR